MQRLTEKRFSVCFKSFQWLIYLNKRSFQDCLKAKTFTLKFTCAYPAYPYFHIMSRNGALLRTLNVIKRKVGKEKRWSIIAGFEPTASRSVGWRCNRFEILAVSSNWMGTFEFVLSFWKLKIFSDFCNSHNYRLMAGVAPSLTAP